MRYSYSIRQSSPCTPRINQQTGQGKRPRYYSAQKPPVRISSLTSMNAKKKKKKTRKSVQMRLKFTFACCTILSQTCAWCSALSSVENINSNKQPHTTSPIVLPLMFWGCCFFLRSRFDTVWRCLEMGGEGSSGSSGSDLDLFSQY